MVGGELGPGAAGGGSDRSIFCLLWLAPGKGNSRLADVHKGDRAVVGAGALLLFWFGGWVLEEGERADRSMPWHGDFLSYLALRRRCVGAGRSPGQSPRRPPTGPC